MSKTLQITDATARQWYKESTGAARTALIETFGEAFFKRQISI